MNLWRYTAVELAPPGHHSHPRNGIHNGNLPQGQSPMPCTGELSGESAAQVRASLRRIGLQVIDLRPVRQRAVISESRLRQTLSDVINRHLCRRRRSLRCELYDSLATMLDSGLPLLEAVEASIDSAGGQHSALKRMLLTVRESLKGGQTLSATMKDLPGWFEPTEVAMVESGQHSGELQSVLSSLAQRGERADELSQKLIGALAYPMIIAVVGLGVAVFLSVKTMPQLTQILTDNGIEAPPLTLMVMGCGQFISHHWLLMLLLILLLPGVGWFGLGQLQRRDLIPRRMQRLMKRLSPRVLRRIAVARLALQLAELARCGIPLVDSIRVTAPTLGNGSLPRALLRVADRLEQGDSLTAGFDDDQWFDTEFRRLLDIGQKSGELPSVLERLGRRYERRSRRLIDRLAMLLEPAVILILAFLVGGVVMASILPLIRLQEIL